MSNPYEVTASTQAELASCRASPFFIGVRNGFLWSPLFAVPAAFVFYDEYTMSLANPLDPVTLTRTRIPLTALHRIAAILQATFTSAVWIVLPWSAVAGLVKLAGSKKQVKLSQNI